MTTLHNHQQARILTDTPLPRVPAGGRWIHEIRAGYIDALGRIGMTGSTARIPEEHKRVIYGARYIVNLLDDPEYRRLVVDSRQAGVFAETEGLPPVDRYRRPFDRMYVEFTEPIKVSQDDEPGHDDYLMALLIRPPDEIKPIDLDPDRDISAVTFLMSDRGPDALDAGDNLAGAQRGRHGAWADRSFLYDGSLGMALSRRVTYEGAGDRGNNNTAEDGSTWPEGMLDDVPEHAFIGARPAGPGRGWWERSIAGHAQFLSWLLTYMTAKGIVIVEEGVSRQVRRAAERAGRVPKPWHVVSVQPTKIKEHEATGGGTKHSYRYDVRGHIRFGRHPRKDGSYSNTVEWIAPHQAGLANAIYIPKTYHYDRKSPRIKGVSDAPLG